VFARVDRGSVSVTVPEGNAEIALIEASSGGVVISGITDTASIDLLPAKPFVMKGLVVPQPSARMFLAAAGNDEVRVKLALPKEVVMPTSVLEETRPCGDVGIDSVSFDTKAPVFGTRTGSRLFMTGGPAQLSQRPDGATVATLRLPPEGQFVSRFDEQGGRSLIGWQTSRVMVFGWVRSARLQEPNVGSGSTGGIGFGRSGAGRIATVAFVRCEADVPLIGEANGEERTVGRILAGTTIGVAAWREPRSQVVVQSVGTGIHAQGGTFSARTAELRACRDITKS